MGKKIIWGMAALGAAAIILIAIYGTPAVDGGTQATIGQANRDETPQVKQTDVKPKPDEAKAQEFLQSDTFDKMVKDPSVRLFLREVSKNAALTQALANPALAQAFATPGFAAALVNNPFLAAPNALVNGPAMAATINQLFANPAVTQALLSNPAVFSYLSANPAAVQALANPAVTQAFANGFSAALATPAFNQALVNNPLLTSSVDH